MVKPIQSQRPSHLSPYASACLTALDLAASKMVALVERGAPRDFLDILRDLPYLGQQIALIRDDSAFLGCDTGFKCNVILAREQNALIS
jgi:hypothetical protein